MNRYTKRIISFLLITVLFISGCTKVEDKKINIQGDNIVVDNLDREIEIPKKIDRIAGLDSLAGELIVMLGGGNRMVATVGGVKSDKLLQKLSPNLEDLAMPVAGGAMNYESMMTLNIDFAFIKKDLYNVDKIKEQLKEMNIPFYVMSYDSIDEQKKCISDIGVILGGESKERAEEFIKYYDKSLEFAERKKKLLDKNNYKKVYHSINQVARTDRANTLSAEWIDKVGIKNVSLGENLRDDGKGVYANLEQIHMWNPEYIICNSPEAVKYIKENEQWRGIDAVDNGKVYQMPVGATRWGHPGSAETPLAIYWLGKVVYPELYSDIDLYEEVKYFYKNVLNLDIDEQTYNMIIEGEEMRKTGGKNPQ